MSVIHLAAGVLPVPKTSFTIPIVVVFAILAAIALLRKLIGLAVIAAVIAAVFIAYQSGAFDHWVDKGKQVIEQTR
ncbi:MAG: hypothetical protein IRZ02_04280 [Acidothermus sp.]|nr:hypothetical protein [Acidothermus sp.]MCL6537249.1 hypothetical protein [Acidothermus sp.]